MSDSDELFTRAERAYDSTLRLLAERVIVTDDTVAALHRGARRHEITLRLLQQSRKQLEKARRQAARGGTFAVEQPYVYDRWQRHPGADG